MTKQDKNFPTLKYEAYVNKQGNVLEQFTFVISETVKSIHGLFNSTYEKLAEKYQANWKEIPVVDLNNNLACLAYNVQYTE